MVRLLFLVRKVSLYPALFPKHGTVSLFSIYSRYSVILQDTDWSIVLPWDREE